MARIKFCPSTDPEHGLVATDALRERIGHRKACLCSRGIHVLCDIRLMTVTTCISSNFSNLATRACVQATKERIARWSVMTFFLNARM